MNNKPAHLKPSSPRMSDLGKTKGRIHPDQCASCGRKRGEFPIDRGLARWQEHDHNDAPEHRLVVLCRSCSNKLVEAHVRLYRPLHVNHPWAGCMEICLDCRWRLGVSCTHPRAQVNGGHGVAVKTGKQMRAFVDGWCQGLVTIFDTPPSACEQKEVVT